MVKVMCVLIAEKMGRSKIFERIKKMLLNKQFLLEGVSLEGGICWLFREGEKKF
jgi:hypothetical protein